MKGKTICLSMLHSEMAYLSCRFLTSTSFFTAFRAQYLPLVLSLAKNTFPNAPLPSTFQSQKLPQQIFVGVIAKRLSQIQSQSIESDSIASSVFTGVNSCVAKDVDSESEDQQQEFCNLRLRGFLRQLIQFLNFSILRRMDFQLSWFSGCGLYLALQHQHPLFSSTQMRSGSEEQAVGVSWFLKKLTARTSTVTQNLASQRCFDPSTILYLVLQLISKQKQPLRQQKGKSYLRSPLTPLTSQSLITSFGLRGYSVRSLKRRMDPEEVSTIMNLKLTLWVILSTLQISPCTTGGVISLGLVSMTYSLNY